MDVWVEGTVRISTQSNENASKAASELRQLYCLTGVRSIKLVRQYLPYV